MLKKDVVAYFEALSKCLSGGIEENYEHISQIFRYPYRDTNLWLAEYDTGVPTTSLWRSVVGPCNLRRDFKTRSQKVCINGKSLHLDKCGMKKTFAIYDKICYGEPASLLLCGWVQHSLASLNLPFKTYLFPSLCVKKNTLPNLITG
jgi:hypothetical protein